MSQEKIEAIILTEDGIMIQEITFMRSTGYQPVLRFPSLEELIKIADGCGDSIKKMKSAAEKQTESEKLLDTMYKEMIEKHGPNNVRMDGNNVVVTEKGKEHKIWVETV